MTAARPPFVSIRPPRCAVLAVLLIAVCWQTVSGQAKTAGSAEAEHLTLSRQTGSQGRYRWCTLIAETERDTGGVSEQCGGAGPFGTSSPGPGASGPRSRSLTHAERATFRQLYKAARLFDGGHVGADFSEHHLPFEILMVRGKRAVVLVTLGNPTFASGPRRALIDWLYNTWSALLRDR
jgi:hypothetical protein